MIKKFPNFKQVSKVSCGITCIKIIAKYYDKIIDVSTYYNKVSRKGISIFDICEIAEDLGLRSSAFEIKLKDLTAFDKPLIIHWNDNHYVVLYKIRKNIFYVSDPTKGLIKYTMKEFCDKWLLDKNKSYVILLEPSEKFKKIKNAKSNYLSAIEFLTRHLSPYKRSLLQLLLIMIIISLIYATLPFITRSIIDVGINTNDINFITIILFANLALLIFKSIGEWIRATISLHIASRIKISIITDYLIKVFSLPVNFIESILQGDIIQRSRDQERIQEFVSNSAISILMSLLILTIYSLILFIFSHILFYIFIISTIVYVLWVMFFYELRKKMDIKYYELMGENQSSWMEILKNFEDIRLNNYALNRRWKWEKIQSKLYDVGIKLLNIDRIQKLGADFINGVKDIGLTFYSAYLVFDGKMTFGTLISVQFIIGQTTGPVFELINFVKQAQSAFISFLRVNDISNKEDEQDKLAPLITNIHLKENDIILNNVSFKYKNSKPILKNVTFRIPGGKTTAIVGPSGTGKTTIFKLISKIYDNYLGDILIGNTNLKNFDNSLLREKLGIVLQDSMLYKESVVNNIVLADEKIYNPEFLEKVLEKADLTNYVASQYKGIHYEINEGGKGLSQGQKQRVLLARAIYKKPYIFLLDEVTNALDSVSEKKILNNITQKLIGRTTVLISHKLSTIKSADHIVVIFDGRVVEEGSYDLLKSKKQYFFNLFKDQFNIDKSE